MSDGPEVNGPYENHIECSDLNEMCLPTMQAVAGSFSIKILDLCVYIHNIYTHTLNFIGVSTMNCTIFSKKTTKYYA